MWRGLLNIPVGVLVGVEGSGDFDSRASTPTFLLVSECMFLSYSLISLMSISGKRDICYYFLTYLCHISLIGS